MNRQKIADIIDRQSHTDRIGAAYDWFMVFAILVSLLPLMFMKSHEVFWYTELGSTLMFIIDYVLRWGTADIRHNNRKTAFLTYPFSFMAIIDLLSILPAVTLSPEEEKKAALILNSINNIKKSRFFLSKHKLICSYLDNDEGGKRTLEQLKRDGFTVQDCSSVFQNYKDLNEYLCAEFKHSEKTENKKIKGIKL